MKRQARENWLFSGRESFVRFFSQSQSIIVRSQGTLPLQHDRGTLMVKCFIFNNTLFFFIRIILHQALMKWSILTTPRKVGYCS